MHDCENAHWLNVAAILDSANQTDTESLTPFKTSASLWSEKDREFVGEKKAGKKNAALDYFRFCLCENNVTSSFFFSRERQHNRPSLHDGVCACGVRVLRFTRVRCVVTSPPFQTPLANLLPQAVNFSLLHNVRRSLPLYCAACEHELWVRGTTSYKL